MINFLASLLVAAQMTVVPVPMGAMCNDEVVLESTMPRNMETVSKTEDEWIVRNTQNGTEATLVPAPESVKPLAFKGRPGWCIIEQRVPAPGEDA